MDRGDIWHVDLDPTKGREQANPRYVLILTPRELNRLGTPVVAPITSGGDFARVRGLAVSDAWDAISDAMPEAWPPSHASR